MTTRENLKVNFNWHYSLTTVRFHTVAAEHAIEATKQFFEDLRTTVGDDVFTRFLNLQAVRTLALVIDDTGSMGGRSDSKVINRVINNTRYHPKYIARFKALRE